MDECTDANEKTPDEPAPGHDARGRFTKGRRPKGTYRKALSFRQRLRAAVTPTEFRQVVAALVKAAGEGNVSAARLLLQNLCSVSDAEWDQRLNELERQIKKE